MEIFAWKTTLGLLNNFGYTIENRVTRWKFYGLKKPMHFREGVKYQDHQKLFKKGLNLVSRAVLSPDKDNVGNF